MIQIVQLHGTDKKLYELVAPLVMSPEVLKQNYNYPFRTSEEYEWFVALDNKHVVGFELGFLEDKVWTRYVKMKKNR